MDHKDFNLIRESFATGVANGNLELGWKKLHDTLESNPACQRILRQVAITDDGQELLATIRQEWSQHGFDAPFDFIFEDRNVFC